MKTVFFATLFFISACFNGKKQHQIDAHASFDYSTKEIVYSLINKSDVAVFIPSEYYKREIVNDTVVFESYFKSPIINYNQFIPPIFKSLKTNAVINGRIKCERLNNAERLHLYFRVFDEDLSAYKLENKMQIITHFDFEQFEKKHSFLVKANLVASNSLCK